MEQHHTCGIVRHTCGGGTPPADSCAGEAPSLWNLDPSHSQSCCHEERVGLPPLPLPLPLHPPFLISETSESSNLKKKNSEPQQPLLWPFSPLPSLCLPAPSLEGGSSGFMNGDIWVTVNRANLKTCVSGLFWGS